MVGCKPRKPSSLTSCFWSVFDHSNQKNAPRTSVCACGCGVFVCACARVHTCACVFTYAFPHGSQEKLGVSYHTPSFFFLKQISCHMGWMASDLPESTCLTPKPLSELGHSHVPPTCFLCGLWGPELRLSRLRSWHFMTPFRTDF